MDAVSGTSHSELRQREDSFNFGDNSMDCQCNIVSSSTSENAESSPLIVTIRASQMVNNAADSGDSNEDSCIKVGETPQRMFTRAYKAECFKKWANSIAEMYGLDPTTFYQAKKQPFMEKSSVSPKRGKVDKRRRKSKTQNPNRD